MPRGHDRGPVGHVAYHVHIRAKHLFEVAAVSGGKDVGFRRVFSHTVKKSSYSLLPPAREVCLLWDLKQGGPLHCFQSFAGTFPRAITLLAWSLVVVYEKGFSCQMSPIECLKRHQGLTQAARVIDS